MNGGQRTQASNQAPACRSFWSLEGVFLLLSTSPSMSTVPLVTIFVVADPVPSCRSVLSQGLNCDEGPVPFPLFFAHVTHKLCIKTFWKTAVQAILFFILTFALNIALSKVVAIFCDCPSYLHPLIWDLAVPQVPTNLSSNFRLQFSKISCQAATTPKTPLNSNCLLACFQGNQLLTCTEV